MIRCLPIIAWLLLLAAAVPLGAATPDDPYVAWMQGRPAEAVPVLHERAQAGGDWSAWYDCGLAAAAAGDPGHATAWLLEAHRRAPAQAEPLQALRAGGAAIPATWSELLGPLGWPGRSWWGAATMGVSGALLGWWLAAGGQRRRRRVGALGCLAFVVAAPGALAGWCDARIPYLAVTADTALVDSTGAAMLAVRAGTVVRREPQPPWNGRVLVRLDDGQRGYVPLVDAY